MIQQSTTYTFTFLMVLTSDHISPATTKTVTVNLSKAGATFAAAAGTVTEIANGWYKCALTAADTGTLGDLSINCTATACDPTDTREQIVLFGPLTAVPTVIQIRTEMDTNSTKLANLDATISSRSTFAGGAVASVTGAVGSVTGSVGSVTGAVGSVTGAVGSVTAGVTVTTNNDKTGYALSVTPPTAVQVRQEIDANSTKLDVATSTRLATAGYTVPPTATQNADGLLTRDMSAVVGEAARSPLNAFRAIRNKVARSGATLTVYKEDGTTPSWTSALVTDGTAVPIVTVNPS